MTKPAQPAISKSALMLRSMYELYAKMLAVENIQVVFDEAISAPAQFDILNRVLYIAPVHSAQVELIPGLVIHEVGHALFSILSPEDSKKLKRISRLLNIIDDGYQERMTCKKYANAKKHLFTIFDHFFLKEGDKHYTTDNKLVNIVNTLNFNCKGFKHGHYKKYPSYVLPEDLDLLRQAEGISEPSLLKRDEFAKELAKALKKYGEMSDDGGYDVNKNGKQSDDKSDADHEEDEDGGEEVEDEDGSGQSEDGDEDADGEPDGNMTKPGAGSKNADQEIDDMLGENEDLLNDHHKKFDQNMSGDTTYELPTGQELLGFSEVVDIYEKNGQLEKAIATCGIDLQDKYKNCQKEAKKIAGQIFTKFNMRRQAMNYANTQYKKSGSLDPTRAALYKVYDDVFMKNAIRPNQTNHAYSIVLDWSGSMSGSIYALVLRIMELTYFAKMANVEIEVWLYTTSMGAFNPKGVHRNIACVHSRFFKVLNTKKNNPIELEHRLKHLWHITRRVAAMSPKIDAPFIESKFQLGGTNILEGLILGHHVLSMMDAQKKGCFLLSDGADTSVFSNYYRASDGARTGYKDKSKIYVHGMDVRKAYPKLTDARQCSKAAIADIYREAGQSTIGVAWNTSVAYMVPYCDNVIKCNGSSRGVSDGYVYTENMFVDEIVKNLL